MTGAFHALRGGGICTVVKLEIDYELLNLKALAKNNTITIHPGALLACMHDFLYTLFYSCPMSFCSSDLISGV